MYRKQLYHKLPRLFFGIHHVGNTSNVWETLDEFLNSNVFTNDNLSEGSTFSLKFIL